MTYGYTEWANSLVDHNPKHRCLPHCSYMLSMQVTSCCQTLRAHPYHARSLLVNTHCLHAVHSNFSCGSRLPQLRQHSHKVTTKCRSASRLDVQAVSAGVPRLVAEPSALLAALATRVSLRRSLLKESDTRRSYLSCKETQLSRHPQTYRPTFSKRGLCIW